MIEKIQIKNFKSILDHTIELGRINVFIGENGAGKTNILEAVATAGEAIEGKLTIEGLYARGARIAKPAITLSSFLGMRPKRAIELIFSGQTGGQHEESQQELLITPQNTGEISAQWDVRQRVPIFGRFQNTEAMIRALQKYARVADSRVHIELARLLPGVPGFGWLEQFCIYNLNILALRGLQVVSRRTPLGIHGENLDVFISSFSANQIRELARYSAFISWFDKLLLDKKDERKFQGHKLGRSVSTLYFRDRFMRRGNNIFSAENANEGILHVLFYLALFLGKETPPVFGIDNIETALNPQLCRELMKALAALSKKHDKQALITTHNPAILDGLNLHDDDQRLFVVYRNDQGHTVTKRIKLKPETGESKYKLSELWMRGHLGGLPKAF